MKKKSSIIISSVAAVSILASAFAFNSFAVEKPVDESPITTSNLVTLATTNTDSSTATKDTLKVTPVSTSVTKAQKDCPKTKNSNIKSAENTKTNAKKIDLSSLRAKLESLLKAQSGSTSANKCTTTSTTKPTKSAPTTTAPTTTAPATSKPASSTPAPTTNGDYSAFQKRVVELVNAERAKNGLKLLTMNAELSKVATLKSQDMAKLNYFDHNSPTYGSPFDMMKKYGISYRTAGENIAMGQTSPEQVMEGWMNSPGHRANILKASFTQIGVGVAKNSSGRLYWTQQFIG